MFHTFQSRYHEWSMLDLCCVSILCFKLFCTVDMSFSIITVVIQLWSCYCMFWIVQFFLFHLITVSWQVVCLCLQWHLQLEKELLLTKPGQPHQGVNLCSNVHEAWNFTTPLWSRISHQTTYCACTTMKNPPRLAYWMTDPSGVVQAKILTAGRFTL